MCGGCGQCRGECSKHVCPVPVLESSACGVVVVLVMCLVEVTSIDRISGA